MSVFNIIKQYFKIFFMECIYLVLHIFWIFPVRKNQVCFSTYTKQCCCSPKYIYEYLKGLYGDKLLYIWIVKNNEHKNNDNTLFIRYKSFKYFFYSLTSKINIVNAGFVVCIPYRKNQVLVDTWHGGGAYKKVGITGDERQNTIFNLYYLKKNGRRLDCFISSNGIFTEVMAKSYYINTAKFLPYGMPRNDLFFSLSLNKSIIKKRIELDEASSIILYAPTYRGKIEDKSYNINKTGLDFSNIINAAKTRFDKNFILLYRSHHLMEKTDANWESCKDVSEYPDMQELLYITDILITDYSSSMWDFSFTFRPGFLFTPDIEAYKNDRDFYTPISEWPFPFATTNEQLCENIINYNDEENIEKIKRHHTALGSYENGDASKKISDFIMTKIGIT